MAPRASLREKAPDGARVRTQVLPPGTPSCLRRRLVVLGNPRLVTAGMNPA